MHMIKEDVMINIHDKNDHIAEHVHEHLAEHGIFAVNLMGAPGVGKTSTLEHLLKQLEKQGVPGYVIEGDIESDIDTERCAGSRYRPVRSILLEPVIWMRRSCIMRYIRCSLISRVFCLLKM